ncbi:hypothetical protein [Rhodococcus sp. IEGM1428]|uniref:hypothetical protein n=1 Tax=Rhodococcus sp. IEGM1428 TaxID=3392191 RepID=UPI003D0FBFC1
MSTDAELLAYAEQWVPYGGPDPADVFVRFGINALQFRARLEQALKNHDGIDEEQRTRVSNYLRM